MYFIDELFLCVNVFDVCVCVIVFVCIKDELLIKIP